MGSRGISRKSNEMVTWSDFVGWEPEWPSEKREPLIIMKQDMMWD